jgi:hypothetical protein
MEILTPKSTRRSTRIRVEIPVNVTSLDRRRPFADACMVLVVSAQGCGFRSVHPMPLETPIMLSGLPGGRSVTGRVANCLPLGHDGKQYLIGAALYTHGNVWGIADPPADWASAADTNPVPSEKAAAPAEEPSFYASKRAWPYNIFAEGGEAHPGRK